MVNSSAAQSLAGVEHDGHGNGAGPPEWVPPTSREEADEAVLLLSNDIGLILAQLAEDQLAWCARTGRSPTEYAAWRRRALFAKVHKESQLRECKRIRGRLAAGFAGAGGEAGALSVNRGAVEELVALCREAVEAWLDGGGDTGSPRVDAGLTRLGGAIGRVTFPSGAPWGGSSGGRAGP